MTKHCPIWAQNYKNAGRRDEPNHSQFLGLVIVDRKKYEEKGTNFVEMFFRSRRAFTQSLAPFRHIFCGQRSPNLKNKL